MKHLLLLAICAFGFLSTAGQVLEAENGEKSGTQTSTQRSGYFGAGYVTGFDSDGDKVTVNTYVSRGIYEVYIRYASEFGEKYNNLAVNGEITGSVTFPLTSTFRETAGAKVYLEKGANQISIVKDWGYVDIDNFRIEPSEASAIYNVDPDLVTISPSAEADSLYKFLHDLYGKVILTGQYGGATEFDRIANVSGKTPVIRGFDMIDYSPSRVERGTTSTETEKAIAWNNNEKGIVTFAWHWNAPKDLVDQPGKEWWRGFYTEATTFNVQTAMADQTSEEYSLILRDIDAIAVQLRKLQDAGVPVLWRPLHEAEGKWFWWGAKGPEPCKWLWQLLFERLVNHHQLNNLIWVWTSTGNPSALDWYPGDEYVDIIGADIYLPDGTYGSSFTTFDNMADLYEGRKIIALSENGPIPDPERLFLEKAAWSWFSTWGGDFITNGVTNSATHIDHVYNHDYAITLDEVDSLDSIVARLDKRRQQLEQDGGIVSVQELPARIAIFPNPVSANTNIEIASPDCGAITRIEMFDTQGRMVSVEGKAPVRTCAQFSLNHIAPGIYFLKVRTRTEVVTFRIIKL
jgi:mannan endo-1,4-beta-mannosidase